MRRNRLLRWVAFSVFCVIAASSLFSAALEGGWLRRSLAAKLAASFGRPVEVGRFGFSIFGGPQLRAESVTVAEDPRFGQEYFLRADQLTARLRWTGLLRGRVEFDRLSLSHPSLNLVRNPDGQWNVQTWLPPANDQDSIPSHARAAASAHGSQIQIDGGRINFKRGADKLPFALLNLSGIVTRQGDGRWLLNLQAHPMRAAVTVQAPGTLQLRGTVSGTSSRLQPADLKLSWAGASIADAARLARGTDYGLRGLLDADFGLQVEGPGSGTIGAWRIEGGIRLQAVHRWNLAGRPDNPTVNVKIAGAWFPAESRVEIERWFAEAPHSHLNGAASFDWSHGFSPAVRLLDSQIDFTDAASWARGFISGRTDGLEATGNTRLEASVVGWPPRVEDARLDGTGATLGAGDRFAAIRIGPLHAVWSHSSLIVAPLTVRLSVAPQLRASRTAQPEDATDGIFQIDGIVGPVARDAGLRDSHYKFMISGQTARVQNLRAAVAALGWQFAPNWSIDGPASLRLMYAGTFRPGTSSVHGQVQFNDLRLASTAIKEPITVTVANVEFSPDDRRVQISGAHALGATWDGIVERKKSNTSWSFDLSAERMDVQDLGRDLGQTRQNLIYRLLPFGASSGLPPKTEAAMARISAQGHVRIHELGFAALHLEDLDALAQLEHGTLLLRRAQADFYGGRVTGEFSAQLGGELRYSFRGQVDRTDLSALADLTSMKNGFGGIASGELDLAARGVGREALVDSLQGEGFLHVQEATIGILDLPVESADIEIPRIGGNRFRSSSVSFRIENGHVRVDPWLLSARQRQVEIVGDIDFKRQLNLQVRSSLPAERLSSGPDPAAAGDLWVIGGTLETPQIIREERTTAGNQTPTRSGR